MELQVVLLSVSDMGFAEGALTREIIGSEADRDLFGNPAPFTGGRLQQLGLKLCPPEAGPHLRLQYSDQPRGEYLYVAMKPIATDDGEPRIFTISHGDNGLSLDAVPARPTDYWTPDVKFIASQE